MLAAIFTNKPAKEAFTLMPIIFSLAKKLNNSDDKAQKNIPGIKVRNTGIDLS